MKSPIREKSPWVVKYFLLGGICFWAPDVLLHAIRGHSYTGTDMILLTVFLPAAAFAGFAILWRLHCNRCSCTLIALSMLAGILIQGPLYMAIGLSFAGGKFFKMGALWFLERIVLMLPFALLEMSTYDGTLFALGLVTVGMVYSVPRNSDHGLR